MGRRVRAVFETAAELTGDARDAYLATHAADPALRREMLSLLAVDTARRAVRAAAADDARAVRRGDAPARGPPRGAMLIVQGDPAVAAWASSTWEQRADDAYQRRVAIKIMLTGTGG